MSYGGSQHREEDRGGGGRALEDHSTRKRTEEEEGELWRVTGLGGGQRWRRVIYGGSQDREQIRKRITELKKSEVGEGE